VVCAWRVLGGLARMNPLLVQPGVYAHWLQSIRLPLQQGHNPVEIIFQKMALLYPVSSKTFLMLLAYLLLCNSEIF